MAGIYIPNMKKPASCMLCPSSVCIKLALLCNGPIEAINLAEKRSQNLWQETPDDCPLIEVPDHGDLIDRDSLEPFFIGSARGDILQEWATIRRSDIDYADVVIPADKTGD